MVHKAFPEGLTLAARFLNKLRLLPRGHCLDLTKDELQDFVLLVPPDQRMTFDEVAEWFRVRTPFPCTMRYLPDKDIWVYHHVDRNYD